MLRDATPADLDFVHALYMDESINPYIAYDPMPRAEFEPIYWELLETVQLLIFEEDDQPCGMGQIHWGTQRFAHSAHLGGIAIAPGRQGEGLGTRLMENLLERLQARKIVRVELCVSADNPRGIAFYDRFGFEREGTMKQYFSRAGREGFVDEHLMARFLR